MSVLKVPLDAASSVTTPLEALSVHVQMDTDWLLMEKFAMVCTCMQCMGVFLYLQVTCAHRSLKKLSKIQSKRKHTNDLIDR